MRRSTSMPRHMRHRPSATAQIVTGPRMAAGLGVAASATSMGVAASPHAHAAIPAPAAAPAAAPTTTAVKANTTTTRVTVLSYGSRGSLVSTAQQRLGGLAVDGSFGPATLQRVRSYQSAKGLQVDGYIGPETWRSLGGFPGSSAGSAPDTCSVSTIRYGSTGSLVRTAQQRLGGLAVDGSFGPATLAKVRQYQRSKGLPVTGAVDAATWRSLGCAPSGGGTSPISRDETRPGAVAPNAAYRLPFRNGQSYRITQGTGDTYSHNNIYNRNSVDFATPTGTPLVASRAGTVHSAGYLASTGNYVKIKDASGLCQAYLHLDRIQVSRGQYLAQGQQFGTSGATGPGTGPHLHFQMMHCNSWVSTGAPTTVEVGSYYQRGTSPVSMNR